MIDLEDEDAPPELIDVSELPESERPQPETASTSSDVPAQDRVPITLVTGTDSSLSTVDVHVFIENLMRCTKRT